MEFLIAGNSDVGTVRRVNQDSLMLKKLDTVCGKLAFACVCDGMGGLQSGEVASATVLCGFASWIDTRLPLLLRGGLKRDAVFSDWGNVVFYCNERIQRYGAENGIRLGTTLTALLLTEKEYFLVNIGDTRAYEISCKGTRLLTRDHSFVQQETDAGRMTPEQAAVSPDRSILTRCVGGRPEAEPDFYHGRTRRDTSYLLCSDGFRHELTVKDMQNAFASGISSEEELSARELELIELNKQRGETDNISVAVIRTATDKKPVIQKLFNGKGSECADMTVTGEIVLTDSDSIIS